jgi:hypothetical protein
LVVRRFLGRVLPFANDDRRFVVKFPTAGRQSPRRI